MTADQIAWGTIAVGLVLVTLDGWACWYFWQRARELPGNWVLASTFRVVATITIGCAVLTLSRAYSLLYEPSDLLRFIAALAVTWILLVPWLKYREYKKHEGDVR